MYFGKKLLIMMALASTAVGANAEIVDGVRQQPLPQKSELTFDTEMYLFNTGSKKFFAAGDPYQTRGQLSDTPYKVKITDNGDGTYLLQDYVLKFKEWRCTFADGWDSDDEDELPDGNVWVDNSGHEGRFWALTNTGNDVYRIAIAPSVSYASSWPTPYLSTKKDGSDLLLYWHLTPEQGNIDWYFVKMSDLDAYTTLLATFKVAESLKEVIDEAKAAGIDVSAQEKVYLDESASVETMEAATAEVKAALAAAEEGKVTADQPADKTSLITNPSYDNNNNTGWSGDAPAFQTWTDAEFYQKKFNTYQTITNAPKGVYAVNVQAFYRSGFSENAYDNYVNRTQYDAKLYAEANEERFQKDIVNPFSEALTEALGMNESKVTADGTDYYIPNNMQTAEEYFKLGKYNNKLFFSTEDGNMTIGMQKDNSEEPNGNWVLYDNWSLTYYGNGADAYTLWLNEAKNAAPDYSTLPEETLVTNGMIDNYNATLAGLTSASNKEEVLAAIATIDEATAAVDANIAAWKAFKAAFAKGEDIANDGDIVGDDKDNLGDYVGYDGQDIINALELSTDEIIAETAKLNEMIDAAIRNGITPGTDVTGKYLVNADFETKDKGWTVEKASGGNVGYGGSDNKCFEAWNNSNFDIYQEVKDAPRGVYEISVQGFYRYYRGDNAYNAYTDGTAPNDAVNIYVNKRNAHFKSVFDEPVANGELYTNDANPAPYVDPNGEYWYPNDMVNGSIAFANDMYKATSFGVVANAGDVLRIGVKGNTSQKGDSWAIWDNFKMVFRGTEPEAVKQVLPDVITDLETTINEGKTVGKTAAANAATALATAQETLNGTDGAAMFQALCDAIDANAALQESAVLFAGLQTKVEDLISAHLGSSASEAVKTEASDLIDEIQNGMNAGTIEDVEVATYIEKIEALIVKLAIPADVENASDQNPVPLTSLIKTPSFEKEGANSIEGWEGTTGYNFGNDDTQKGALALEFYNKDFDMYQTIEGLPEGSYVVAVNAFCRMGSRDNDYSLFNQGEETTAYVYAETATDRNETAVKALAAEASEDLGIGGTKQITDTELYVPDDMVSAVGYFEMDAYINKVALKVADGESLKIGIRHTKTDGREDWVIMDNWTLTYYGKNSTVTGVDNVVAGEPAKVEIFNTNGMKTKGFSRGVNIIRMTDAEGNVTVKKVNVR